MAASNLTVINAEEKRFTVGATVSALYDDWDSTSSALSSLLVGSSKARVTLKNNPGTSAVPFSKGFLVDFGQSYSPELVYI